MSVTFEDWQDQAAALFDTFAEPCLVQRGALPVVSTRAVAYVKIPAELTRVEPIAEGPIT